MAVGAIIDNGEGTKELSEILKSVRKEASSLEKQGVIRVIKSTLMDDLSDKLFQSEAYKKRDMNGGFVEQPSRNAFQADTMMAYRVMKGDTDMVYSNDSVFRVYLGPEFCYIKFANMKTKDANFDFAGVGNELMTKIENALNHETNIFYKKAEHPVLATQDQILRSFIAIILGADLYKAGVLGVGTAEVFKFVKEEKLFELTPNEAHEKIIDYILKKSRKKNNLTEDDIRTLSSALLCEPIVESNEVLDKSKWSYLYGKPSSLPTYLKNFKHQDDDEILIVSGPSCITCPGIPGHNKSHSFLAFEGMAQCSLCSMTLCRTCYYHETFFADSKGKKRSTILLVSLLFYVLVVIFGKVDQSIYCSMKI